MKHTQIISIVFFFMTVILTNICYGGLCKSTCYDECNWLDCKKSCDTCPEICNTVYYDCRPHQCWVPCGGGNGVNSGADFESLISIPDSLGNVVVNSINMSTTCSEK